MAERELREWEKIMEKAEKGTRELEERKDKWETKCGR